MSPVPQGWEQAHTDRLINQTLPVFGATDQQYEKMDRDYCREKIDAGCMWLWRKDDIDWDHQSTTKGIAIAFLRWRPRKIITGEPKEQRICLCLFLGTEQDDTNAMLADLETAVRAFADDQVARARFYIVKEVNVTYPDRVEAVFNAVSHRLTAKANFRKEYGWPRRHVWKIDDWS